MKCEIKQGTTPESLRESTGFKYDFDKMTISSKRPEMIELTKNGNHVMSFDRNSLQFMEIFFAADL